MYYWFWRDSSCILGKDYRVHSADHGEIRQHENSIERKVINKKLDINLYWLPISLPAPCVLCHAPSLLEDNLRYHTRASGMQTNSVYGDDSTDHGEIRQHEISFEHVERKVSNKMKNIKHLSWTLSWVMGFEALHSQLCPYQPCCVVLLIEQYWLYTERMAWRVAEQIDALVFLFSIRVWVRVPVLTLVSLSQTLSHYCCAPRMGHKAVGPVCCVMHVKEPATFCLRFLFVQALSTIDMCGMERLLFSLVHTSCECFVRKGSAYWLLRHQNWLRIRRKYELGLSVV